MKNINSLIDFEYDECQKYEMLLKKHSDELAEEALKVRNQYFGRKLFVRASIEISNYCDNKCAYCGMSKLNTTLKRYALPIDIIKKTIDEIAALGIKQVHMVGGEYADTNLDEICDCIKYAHSNGLHTTVVLGKKSEEEYQCLYDAGAERYIIKFETSNPVLFEKYKHSELNDRLEQLFILRKIGFKIGTGIIVDLPGTSFEDDVRSLKMIDDIKPDMASASEFSPNGESKLKDYKANGIENTLKFISAMRIVLNKNTPIISCSSSLGGEGQYRALMSGANLISYHATPKDYINCFSSYRSKDRIKRKLEEIEKIAFRCNLEIGEYV